MDLNENALVQCIGISDNDYLMRVEKSIPDYNLWGEIGGVYIFSKTDHKDYFEKICFLKIRKC